MHRTIYELFLSWRFSETLSLVLTTTALGLFAFLVALLAYLVARRLVVRGFHALVRRTKSKWDDILVDRGVLNRLSNIAPAIVIYLMVAIIFPDIEVVVLALRRVVVAYMIFVAMRVLDSVLEATNDIYRTYEMSKRRPIKGYIQLVKILVYVVGVVLIVTTILDKSPLGILTGIGTMSAVLLLVFRDSILGLVSGIQLSGNDQVRIGDWIEMPKYGADGDVIDITLQTIKVQNWDMTITTIPIYALVSDSFKNWRGMSESGGRRIKRSIHIDMRSVKFCTPEMLDRFRRFSLLRDYIERKETEIEEHNQRLGIDGADVVSGRRLTNLGTFRAYVAAYLHANPKVHPDLTFLVRQLQPGPTGLPIEVYVFSSDQAWANYEGIQADIFDHLLAVLREFDLRVYQEPSGWDLQAIAQSIESNRDAVPSVGS